MELKEFIDILVWINEKKHFQTKIKISCFICKKNIKLLKYFWNVFRFRIVITIRSRIDVLKRSISMAQDIEWHSKFLKTARPTFFFSYGNTHVVKRRWPQHSILTSADIATGQWAREWEKCESRKEIVKLFEIKWQYFRDRGERKKKLDKLKN